MGRAYLYWTPHKWLALGADYLYEKTKSETGEFKLKTNRIPLSINFFHPSGAEHVTEGGFTMIRTATFLDPLASLFQPVTTSGWSMQQSSTVSRNVTDSVTVGVRNLFDREFNYYETDSKNATIQPDRMVFATVTLQF